MNETLTIETESFKTYLESLDKKELISQLITLHKTFSHFYKPTEAINKWYKNEAFHLFPYRNYELLKEKVGCDDITQLLITIANDYAKFIRVDDIVTSELANDEPEVYARLLLRRRHIRFFDKDKELDHYTINKLSKYANDPNSLHAKLLLDVETSKEIYPGRMKKVAKSN